MAAPRVPTIDLGPIWSSIFQDPGLIAKTAIGSILLAASMLLVPAPFTMPVLVGYSLMVVRNAILGEAYPLPDWGDFGLLWMLGAKYVLSCFAYLMPFFFAGGAAFGLMMGGAILSKSAVGQVMVGLGVALWYLFIFGMNIVGLVARFTLFPTMALRLAATDDLASLFSPRELLAVFRENPWNIMLASVFQYVTGFAVLFGCCLLILPAFPIWFLGQAFWAACLGSAERLRAEAMGDVATQPGIA